MEHASSRRVARVITVSDRASTGQREDRSGPAAEALLEEAGWTTDVRVVPDDIDAITGSIRSAIDAGCRLVVTTGGTGVAPRDVTPQATAPLLRLELPGIAEQIRRVGAENVAGAILSRGVAGVLGTALVVNVAGSTGAVRDGIPVILSVADHVLSQLDGGDH
ncbi:MogA/MoaB family molybdenum cofactor biosynthesis protein [Paramicrobacterium chengjingii]|uniref:MogA/MoaB family molybdenum cofactor biosynthesis protein n=1 Tax=Paramicrobacterium chengjingii TaxID=2769067 RepID=A0ABX6YFL8_9MICO|nr:MogA/MoaB family molybdenum cofactor biosynthesis protein [Microbacterium chengjingii]QPZ37533.1 MogA/MoaB family molybdenum cofactor biosynthesis protein [Microbacterium chengjingii]